MTPFTSNEKKLEEKSVRRSQRNYTLDLKLQVISLVESGQCTYKEAQRRFGIKGKSTILVWLRKQVNAFNVLLYTLNLLLIGLMVKLNELSACKIRLVGLISYPNLIFATLTLILPIHINREL